MNSREIFDTLFVPLSIRLDDIRHIEAVLLVGVKPYCEDVYEEADLDVFIDRDFEINSDDDRFVEKLLYFVKELQVKVQTMMLANSVMKTASFEWAISIDIVFKNGDIKYCDGMDFEEIIKRIENCI